jgi:hypothetical protein
VIDGESSGITVLQRRDLQRMQGEDVGDVACLAVAHLDAERAHEHESGQTVATPHRDLRRDPSAQRAADQHDVAQIALGQKVQVEVREIVDGVDAVDLGRESEARVRRGEDAGVAGHEVQIRRGGIEAFLAVEPQHRTSRPALEQLERYPLHVDHAHASPPIPHARPRGLRV